MSITRRVFLRNSALAVVGTTAVPAFLTRAALGAVETTGRVKRLVVIFQRGAADGLNIVVPHAEPAYYAMRPSINISATAGDRSQRLLWTASLVVVLQAAVGPAAAGHCSCGGLARHHALALRRAGLHGVGHAGREDHQRWLAESHAADWSQPAADSPFRGIALGTSLPRILSGKAAAVAVSNVNGFSIAGGKCRRCAAGQYV